MTQYSAQKKEVLIRQAQELGVPAVAKKHKIHQSTLYAWLKKQNSFGLAEAKEEGAMIAYDKGAQFHHNVKDAILYLRAARKSFGHPKALNRGQLLTLLALSTLEGDSK